MSSLDALHDELDDLWTQYLSHTSTYQDAQREVQALLSTAYFALAQANFNKPSGRRYGRDYYDQRAVAGIRAGIATALSSDIASEGIEGLAGSKAGVRKAQKQLPVTSIELTRVSGKVRHASQPRSTGALSVDETIEDQGKTEPQESEKTKPRPQITVEQLLTPEATPEPRQEGASDEKPTSTGDTSTDLNHDKDEVTEAPEVRPPQPTDPLRSFAGGVLIPPALRKTQKCFLDLFLAESVDGDDDAKCRTPIVDAVNAARAMREVEVEIRRLRKTIRKAERDAKVTGG